MSPLRQKFIDHMILKNLSESTISVYTGSLVSLAAYYHRSPDQISLDEIKHFLLFLINQKGYSDSSCTVAISAFKLFYNDFLGHNEVRLHIPARKTPKRLPEVLSTKEVESIFESIENDKHRTLLMTKYASGLRVSEVTQLRIKDIDSQRMMIRVNQGKGKKDRYTVLSERLLTELKRYYVKYRPQQWFFFGNEITKPMSTSAAQQVYYKAKKAAGITKGGGIHCFATHMLEAGIDLRTLQIIMGHASLSSTAMYLHITMKHIAKAKSPFDLLDIPQKNIFA